MSKTAALASSDRTKILSDVAICLQGKKFDCEWLPGDASNRFYGRLRFPDSSTAILMVMNEPEAFKSEEVTGASEAALKELPFVTVARNFKTAHVRVPTVEWVGPRSEFLICEDLGDELLYLRRSKEKAVEWYERALDELVKIQSISPFSPVADRRFTRELLDWECEHFVEYALLKRQIKVSSVLLSDIRSFMKMLTEKMASAPFMVVHRDFHSKNLMILEQENRVGVIDFQDALLGPRTYDLASLLRDSYVRLAPEEEKHLLDYYEKKSGQILDHELFALTSLQRNFKAVGRFFYISMVKGRDTHLPYVKPTLIRIFQTLKDLKQNRILSLLEGLLKDDVR